MSQGSSVIIRAATIEDVSAMNEIYTWHVLDGTGSFEELPPSIDDMLGRWQNRESQGYPTLIAEVESAIAGYAYADSFKARSAYRFTVEDSIYVSPEQVGRGVGLALLQELIKLCTARQYRQMIAVIGDSDNRASIGLHRRCGFEHIGTARNLGFKFDRWLDVVYMQRTLYAERLTETVNS